MAGDAYALLDCPPRSVALVDGLFDEWPAIRHKELLELMHRGVPLYGGASMGALRAAELQSCGMIGVGRIARAYGRGLIDADDEVAVVHGPAEYDWAALTEPLVNIRATLLRAVRCRVLPVGTARRVLLTARKIFYRRRTWLAVLEDATILNPADSSVISRFEDWLPVGYVDLKRIDAMACVDAALGAAATTAVSCAPPPQTFFSLALARQVAAGRPRP